MVRAGDGPNRFDDMTSEGSYMVRVQPGNSKFDDMSSQGSYMVRANDNDDDAT